MKMNECRNTKKYMKTEIDVYVWIQVVGMKERCNKEVKQIIIMWVDDKERPLVLSVVPMGEDQTAAMHRAN